MVTYLRKRQLSTISNNDFLCWIHFQFLLDETQKMLLVHTGWSMHVSINLRERESEDYIVETVAICNLLHVLYFSDVVEVSV